MLTSPVDHSQSRAGVQAEALAEPFPANRVSVRSAHEIMCYCHLFPLGHHELCLVAR